MAQGSRDYLLKDFWFPNEVFRLTKNPLFLSHPASPWLAQLLTQAHHNIGILPATSSNSNIIAQITVCRSHQVILLASQAWDSCIDTFIKTQLLEENAPTTG